MKNYRLKNKHKISIQQKKYRNENCETIKLKSIKYRNDCDKNVIKNYNKEYYKNNKEKIKNNVKHYRKTHPGSIRETKRKWRNNNKDKINSYFRMYRRKKLIHDEQYILKRLISNSVWKALRYNGNKKNKLLIEYNINVNDIYDLIGERPSPEYHLDHILPISAFNLLEPLHIKACWDKHNLQWLINSDNVRKSNKYNQKDFNEYIERFL